MSDLNLDFNAAARGEKPLGWKELLSGHKRTMSWTSDAMYASGVWARSNAYTGCYPNLTQQTIDAQFQDMNLAADILLNQWMMANQQQRREEAQPTMTDAANRLPDDAHIERLIALVEAERDQQARRDQARADEQWRVIWDDHPVAMPNII